MKPANAMLLKFLLALTLALPLSASAVDINWSGFGTAGYTISDQPYKYQRFIDDHGTLKSDSILGAQVDVKFNQQWGGSGCHLSLCSPPGRSLRNRADNRYLRRYAE